MTSSNPATETRKVQHVDIVLNRDVQAHRRVRGFDDVEFYYYALPEMDYAKIDSSVTFFGKKLKSPLLVTGMTGGAAEVTQINKDVAAACQKFGVAMGLGSQRAMLENPALAKTFAVRDAAPDILLLGNIGAYQLKTYPAAKIERMIEQIDADALAVHLNPLQEVIQPEGDKNWEGVLAAITKLCDRLSVPVLAKEVGAGISGEVAAELEHAGIKAIDVSGVGGTSWSAIEVERKGAAAGETFREWGVRTIDALRECSQRVKVPLIASGGMRSGLDVAKSIRLGATLGGAAYPFIRAQRDGGRLGVEKAMARWVEEVRVAMFLTRSKNLAALKKAKLQAYA